MSLRRFVTIVAAPRRQVGKTLLARLVADYHRDSGRTVRAFDLNPRDPVLSTFLPGATTVAEVGEIVGQMAIFDALVAGDETYKIVDLNDEAFERFFLISRDIGLFDELRDRGIAPVILFISGPDPASIAAYDAINRLFPRTTLVPVRNEVLGEPHYREHFAPAGPGAAFIHLPSLAPGLRRVIAQAPLSLLGSMPNDGDAELSDEVLLDLQRWSRRIFLDLRELELRLLMADLQTSIPFQSGSI